MKDRIKFFSPDDLSIFHYLQMAEGVLDDYENGKSPVDINDYLEIYNIYKFVENKRIPSTWDKKRVNNINELKGKLVTYLQTISPNDLPAVYRSIEFYYRDCFWESLNTFRISSCLNEESIRGALKNQAYELKEILMCKWLVEKHQPVIISLLKENKETAEWLLSEYVQEDKYGNHKTLFFPQKLSLDEREHIILQYINREDANLNYVRLILFAKNGPNLRISDRTRLEAQKRERVLNKEVFSQGTVIPIKYQVQFDEEADTPIKSVKYDVEGNPILRYNSKMLLACKSESLLEYCRRIFEFVSPLGFINLISKQSDSGVFERLMGLDAKTMYKTNTAFRFNEAISWLQIEAMQNILNKNDRNIESELKEVYELYFNKKYNYPTQRLNLYEGETDWLLKCNAIIPEIERVAKRHGVYAECGDVDEEYLSMKSPIRITDVLSTTKKRYFKVNEKCGKLHRLFHLFFSDQCMLNYVDPYKDKHYHSFFDLLSNEKEIVSDNYEEYQKRDLQFLIDEGFVSIRNNIVSIERPYDVLVLKQLHEYRSCPYWQYEEVGRAIVDEMHQKGWVEEDNHLFSLEERKFLSYYLNNELFTNGPALRNKYVHGVYNTANDQENRSAYYRLLIILILLLLKIEDDLILSGIENKDSIDSKKVGTIIKLSELADIETIEQFKQHKSDGYLYLPILYGVGVGSISIDEDEEENSFAVKPYNDTMSTFLRAYLDSGIVRIALQETNKNARLSIDKLRLLQMSVVSNLEQKSLSVLFNLISYIGCLEPGNNQEQRFVDVLYNYLLQIRELICMEIMNPTVTHAFGLDVMRPWTSFIMSGPEDEDGSSIIKRLNVEAKNINSELFCNVKEAQSITGQMAQQVVASES